MRIKTLFAAILAAGLTILSGCRQDEDYVLPSLTVDTQTLEFTTGTELSLELTATRDWLVRSMPDWVEAVSPDSGPGSLEPQRVAVVVEPNAGYDRVGEILFTIGLAKSLVAVSQAGAKGPVPKGSGTLEDPYTVLGVLEYIGTLESNVESPVDVYITGKISSVTEEFSTQYGNGTFKIRGDASTDEFTIYRAYYLNNKKWTASDDQIAVGDEVIICGKVINYNGSTPETQQNKAYVYQHNDKVSTSGGSSGGDEGGTPSGDGTLADPYNPAGAAAAVANLTWTSSTDYQKTDPVYVKGKICKIANNGTYAQSGTYGNASFYISEDGGTDGTQFYIYHALYFGKEKYTSGTDIQVGDEVIIYGPLMNYQGKTPETVGNEAYLYSLNGTTGGSDPGDNSGDDPTGSTAVYEKVTSLTAGKAYLMVGLKENKYYAATPLGSDKTYGRLNGKEVTVSNDQISADMADYEFTIAAVEGGYTIAMPDGRKLAVDTEHDGTFQIGDSYDPVFTVDVADGVFTIAHKATKKTIYHGGGNYTNFSCASSVPEDGALIQLYQKSAE